MTAANKYLAFEFIKRLLKFTSDQLKPSNACLIYDQLLKLKLELDDESLIKRVEKMIKTEISLSDGLTEIDQHTLESILSFDQLYIVEVGLLWSCLDWTDAELKRRGLEATVENKRSLFADLKHLIRFCDLKTNELAELDIENYVESDEAISVFRHSANKSKPLMIEYRSPRVTGQLWTAEIGMSHSSLTLPSGSVFRSEFKFRVNKKAILMQINTQPILIDCHSIDCEIFQENKSLGKWKCCYDKTKNIVITYCDFKTYSPLELEPDQEYRFCFKSSKPLKEPGQLFYRDQLTVRTDDEQFTFTMAGPHHCIAMIVFSPVLLHGSPFKIK